MATIEEQIEELEKEIANTKKNKATEAHIGKLKAKIAKLAMEKEKRLETIKAGGGSKGFYVKKAGNATVALVGFPSVGKSTLLNQLTGAHSEVGAYHFTTLDVVPGVMEYNHAKIQILDMPGLIKDGIISGGMIPKVECCTNAIRAGVRKVFIIDGRVPHALLIETLTDEGAGTMFKKEIEGNYVPKS